VRLHRCNKEFLDNSYEETFTHIVADEACELLEKIYENTDILDFGEGNEPTMESLLLNCSP
jgi:hypothetical protein